MKREKERAAGFRAFDLSAVLGFPVRNRALSARHFAACAVKSVREAKGLRRAALIRERRKMPNQSPEPTRVAVTIPADAGIAPATRVAHL
jgi:hypothetical protein